MAFGVYETVLAGAVVVAHLASAGAEVRARSTRIRHMTRHRSSVGPREVWVWMGVRDIRHHSMRPGVVLLAEGAGLTSPPGSFCLSLRDPDFTFALALALPAERSVSCDARRVFLQAMKEVQAQ